MSVIDETGPGGLFVHRASRTERLAEQLAEAIESRAPANPLAAQTIVVAHPGLRRWLLGVFARRKPVAGGHGIAANFDMIQPWQWLERTARNVLGDAAFNGAAYRREMLRWHIHRVLPEIEAAPVRSYLESGDGERRRFQLAGHLAGLYSQYLVYRPDWILDWEREQPHADWQAEVWQRVRKRIAEPHRAQRREVLLQTLADRGDDEATPLHLFGVSHLPPDIFAALNALARHRPVHVYFPDPCREHWVYLRNQRSLLEHADDPAYLYYELGHPLLAALGRIAQDFCLALEDSDARDEPDSVDEAEAPDPSAPLLAQVQTSIRCCEPDFVGAAVRDDKASIATRLSDMREDASLRVHACHTRLRELEVLRDALLDRLAADSTLHHRDIVIMAPAIEAYAPYLAAVFGEPARYSSDPAHVPWHLADVGLRRTHPLMSAFASLLDLADSRFSVSEVMGLLDVPAVARRFDIAEEEREMLARWLRAAHVAWGLDADMKAASGGAAVEINSWQFGFDRLYTGYLLGGDPPDALFENMLPVDGVSGTSVDAIGGLDRLLFTLRQARLEMNRSRTLSGWCEWLLDLIESLFRADAYDDAETAALDELRRGVAGLSGQTAAAGDDTALPWSVIREAVTGTLDDVSQRQPFLLGGVTFCGLVPQRSIPFNMVCLLGMNEGEFPRPGSDTGLNRMLAKPRRGDRDTRNEDRYLFLEALMAARKFLHISFIGEGVRDGRPCNPAAPLAELLQFLDTQHALHDAKSSRPWLIRHPLQPFDARYYAQALDRAHHDPRLFSYATTYVGADTKPSSDDEPFFDSVSRPVVAHASTKELALSALKRYWRDPARTLLRDGIGLSLDSLDPDVWPDREPLESKLDRRERIERRLVFDAIQSGNGLPDLPPPWLARSGLLAAGSVGRQAWDVVRKRADVVLEAARTSLGETPRRHAQTIDLRVDDFRLVGAIENLYQTGDGSRVLFDASPTRSANFRDLVGPYLEFAALRLSLGEDVQLDFVELGTNATSARRPKLIESMRAQTPEQLHRGLLSLLEPGCNALTHPLLFMPKTAWAWANADADRRESSARDAWEGRGDQMGERDYAPGYAGLLLRDMDLFDAQSPARERFERTTRLVCDALDPMHRVLLSDEASVLPESADTSGVIDER